MTTLADDLVPDELWAMVKPLLPAPPRPPYGGRQRSISDRACLAAIVYMARTSTPWRLLPARELGCGSPTTCWRRLTEWADVGVFEALHLQVLDRLGEQGRVDWERASVVRPACAPSAGDHVGANPVDRGKPGSKLQLVCDGGGLPLAAVVTAANVNDTTVFQAVMDDVPPIRTPAGRRRTRPGKAPRRQGVRQPSQPCLPAAAWDQGADRAASDRVVDPAWAPPVEGRAITVVAELLAAAAGAVGPGLGKVVRLPAGGLRGGVLQPALTVRRSDTNR
jgi:transposase